MEGVVENLESRIRKYVIALSPTELADLANQVRAGTAVVDRKHPDGMDRHEFVVDLQPSENHGEYVMIVEDYGMAH